VDEQFRPILDAVENIESYWHDAWGNISEDEIDMRWNRIEQISESEYIDSPTPSLTLTSFQTYSRAEGLPTEQLPSAEEFETIDERSITQTYTWSPEWKQFILFEATELSTGEKVAVTEDYSASAYALTDRTNDDLRILRADGTIEVVDKSKLLF